VLNFFLIRDPTDPGGQIAWMEQVLRQAEKEGEFVYIIGHIPAGDVTFLSQCSLRYNALTDRFSHIIRGQFFGHTHYDEFRMIPEYFNSTNVIGIIFTAPSLTTYSTKNPSFRVFEADLDTKHLLNYHQYRLNVTKANLTPDVRPKFELSYDAKTVN
jgi:sphingomyelin phosphodiesterase